MPIATSKAEVIRARTEEPVRTAHMVAITVLMAATVHGRRRGGIGGGGRNRGGVNQNPQERQALQELLRPANSLKIDQKDYQVFFSDDQGRETIFFTDGRKISSSNDP